MDKQVLNIDTVCAYNEMLGIETLHPLVSVIEMSRVPLLRHSRQVFGFYAIFLKEVKCGDLIYGRRPRPRSPAPERGRPGFPPGNRSTAGRKSGRRISPP